MDTRTKEMLISISIIITLLLLATPLILGNIYRGEGPSAWISFWGSFSGGILGTFGIIYVAYLQNEAQKASIKLENDEHHRRLLKSEEYQRQRLFIESEINLLKKYSENLSLLKYEFIAITVDTINLHSAILHYNASSQEREHLYITELEKLKKEKDYTYILNLASSVMNDKWVIDDLKNFSDVPKTYVFNSIVEAEDIEGVILRIRDMYKMLTIEGLNIEVFHEKYGKYATYREDDLGMSSIPMAEDLLRWLNKEIAYSKKVLIAETNYLRILVDEK